MIELFRAAESKGLEPEHYDASRWSARQQALLPVSMNSEALARFDVAVTFASLLYLSDLYQGRVTPKECQVDLPEKHFDGAQFLRDEVIHTADVRTAVGKVEPPFDGYQRALAALERYIVLAQEGDAAALPPMPRPLHPGDSYDGTSQLVQRLRQLGDLPADTRTLTSQKYQGAPLISVTRRETGTGLYWSAGDGCRMTWALAYFFFADLLDEFAITSVVHCQSRLSALACDRVQVSSLNLEWASP